MKKAKQKRASDTPIPEAIKDLKEEILDHVRGLANGHNMSIYNLVEKGKELLELEKMEAEKTKKKSPPRPSGDDELFEDEESGAIRAVDLDDEEDF